LEYPEVVCDIRGRSRATESKLPGSSEYKGVVTRSMPVKTEVGAAFFNNLTNRIYTPMKNTDFRAYMEQNALITQVLTPGRLDIFNTTGKSLLQKNLTEGSCTTWMADKGLYILRFESRQQGCFVQKMMVR